MMLDRSAVESATVFLRNFRCVHEYTHGTYTPYLSSVVSTVGPLTGTANKACPSPLAVSAVKVRLRH